MIKLEKSATMLSYKLKEFVDVCIGKMADANTVRRMNADDLEMMQRSMNLMDDALKYMNQQARAIDEINSKLDRLLETKS